MEKKYVPEGVFLTCDKGTTPCRLSVTFNADTVIYGQNLATEADKITGVHVKPMGACAATQGPCLPAPLTWSPLQNDVVVGGNRLLLEDSELQCSQSGRISIFFSLAAAQAACATVPPEKSLLDQADDYLATLGPAGDYLRFQMGVGEGLFAGGKSMVEGLWGLAKGGWNAVTHPVATAEAVGGAASSAWNWASHGDNWANAANSAGQGLEHAADWASHGDNWGKAWDGAADWASHQSPRDWGKLAGRATFEVGMAVGTGGAGEALNVAGKAGEVANVAGKLGEAANLSEKALDAANLAEKAIEAGNAAGKAEVVGIVTNGAEEAADAARVAREAEEAREASKVGETVDGAAKDARTCKKDPVDVATGTMLFDAVDIELPGPVPFSWERTWYSNSSREGALGHGWHHGYDQAVWRSPTRTVFLRLADGRLATFEPLSAENNFRAYNRAEQLELYTNPDEELTYCVFSVRERLTYHFAPVATLATETTFCLLQAVSTAHGHTLRFAYTQEGYLQSITDSAGRRIPVHTDAAGRITAIHLPLPDGSPGTFAAVQYTYDELGNLTAAIDAEGHATHYTYAGHLLVRKTFREGTSFYFEYDTEGRCTRTWGDENYYNGRFFYAEGHTILLTEEPATRHEYFHCNGLVTRYFDPVGAVREWYYNQYGELELARDPLSHVTAYDYDARGNRIAVIYPTGTRELTRYNSQDLPMEVTDVNGNSWHYDYDKAGLLIACRNPLGATAQAQYSEGLLTKIVTAEGALTRLLYDAQYNPIQLLTADQKTRSRTYDTLGRLMQQTDTAGNIQRRYYDRVGRLTELREPDGTYLLLTYDGEGNITRTFDGQQEIGYTYSNRNQLAARHQNEQQVRFMYDREGQLTEIINEFGHTYTFTLNATGQVIAEKGFDNLKRYYQRDAAGRVTALTRPRGVTTYAYDKVGNLLNVAHNNREHATYQYRADGLLIKATNDQAVVAFERDALGQVLRESLNDHEIISHYNMMGQRRSFHSSLGAAVTFSHDTTGNLTQIMGKDWHGLLEYDAEGLELQRTMSGGLRTTWQRDVLGRPVMQRIGSAHATKWQRRYKWQANRQLLQIEDTILGATNFVHDKMGNLTGAHYADGTQELRCLDAAGNLFRTIERTDRAFSESGQVLIDIGTKCRYDVEGNLTRKTTADHKVWHYTWDDAGQLSSVKRPDGYTVSFTYDALGRRLSKQYRGRVTRWLWDGDRPLHEWHELVVTGNHSVDDLATWLFEQNSFIPIAKLTERQSYSIVADHLGTPLAMYNSQGVQTWQMQLDICGEVRRGLGKPQDCPFRYQGQYEDVETSLYYNRFRYYDPQLGQFISQDPNGLAGGNPNLYGYVFDTTTEIDPFGLECKFWRKAKKQYWKDKHAHESLAPTGKYSPDNLGRMQKGKPPMIKAEVTDASGASRTANVPIELHHTRLPQRSGSLMAHESWNLTEATPWGHASMDPYRQLGDNFNLSKILNGTSTWTK